MSMDSDMDRGSKLRSARWAGRTGGWGGRGSGLDTVLYW
jgi:hypothetical protein